MNRILLPKLDPCFADRAHFSVLTRVASKDVRRRRVKGCRARSGGFHGTVIDFNANFSHTYSFVYFEIVHIVEATYSENMKPMCRYNQL